MHYKAYCKSLGNHSINSEKTVLQAFHVSTQEQHYLIAISNALWKVEGIKYLGINFTSNLNDLAKINIPLFSQVQKQLEIWNK